MLVKKVISGSMIGDRRENQDAYFICPENKIYAVFDGLGGVANGAKASCAARDALAKLVAKGGPLHLDMVNVRLRDAVKDSMGMTTATIAQIQNDRLIVWSIGDSPCYRIRKHKIKELHSDPFAMSSTTFAIPRDELVQTADISLKSGDRVLVCSDAIQKKDVYEMLDEEERFNIESIFWSMSFREKSDNLTYILVEVY